MISSGSRSVLSSHSNYSLHDLMALKVEVEVGMCVNVCVYVCVGWRACLCGIAISKDVCSICKKTSNRLRKVFESIKIGFDSLLGVLDLSRFCVEMGKAWSLETWSLDSSTSSAVSQLEDLGVNG